MVAWLAAVCHRVAPVVALRVPTFRSPSPVFPDADRVPPPASPLS